MKWDNIDLRNSYILVEHSKNDSRREVPINNAVREVFSGMVRREDTTYVFSDGKGGVFKGGRNAFERACLRAGIYGFRFHDLRHTAASFMAIAGDDIMAIRQVLGHKTIQMTLRYSHLSPGHLRNAVAVIGQALTAPDKSTSQFTSQSPENGLPVPSAEVIGIRK